MANTNDAKAFLRLMKIYSVDYTASHDQTVPEQIIESDYVFRMGPHILRGRDGAYRLATRKQFDQFPHLGFTVHEVHTSGRRLVMRFTEHGASARHDGRECAWEGIGLYEWNGSKIVSVSAEQDYYSRARQLRNGQPNPLEAPALAPWDGEAKAPDAAAEGIVRHWLEAGGLTQTPAVLCDDAWAGHKVERIVDQREIAIEDLFSCGDTVAFHAIQRGALLPGFVEDHAMIGLPVELYAAGLVQVRDGVVAEGRVIRNRLELQRSLSGLLETSEQAVA